MISKNTFFKNFFYDFYTEKSYTFSISTFSLAFQSLNKVSLFLTDKMWAERSIGVIFGNKSNKKCTEFWFIIFFLKFLYRLILITLTSKQHLALFCTNDIYFRITCLSDAKSRVIFANSSTKQSFDTSFSKQKILRTKNNFQDKAMVIQINFKLILFSNFIKLLMSKIFAILCIILPMQLGVMLKILFVSVKSSSWRE